MSCPWITTTPLVASGSPGGPCLSLQHRHGSHTASAPLPPVHHHAAGGRDHGLNLRVPITHPKTEVQTEVALDEGAPKPPAPKRRAR